MSVRARGASYLQGWLLRLLFFLAAATPVRADCPRACVCNVPTEMHCTFRYLATIPDPIQPHVERINFGYNSINALRENDFLGLEKLELLMLHSNMIMNIEDNTFQDLKSLQVLKMSFNKIKKINKKTFKGLQSLMRLYLDHNQIAFINPEAFHGLTNLQLVHLEGNHLQQLHPDTFITMRHNQVFKVSSIRTLHLSDNQLETLPADVFSGCSKLENLFLHGNPWACDCRMSWFAGWAQKNTGLFKCKRDKKYPNGLLCPVCQNPVHYKNRNLFLLPMDALTCSKPWIYPHLKHKNITVDEGDFTPVSPRDFIAPLGTIQMNLSNQFQSDASLSCSVQRPSAFENLNQTLEEEEENNVILLTADITSYLVCNIEYEQIQRLWQILATYSDTPMRLERGLLLTRSPEMVYQYSEIKTEEGTHTDVEAEIKASPAWLMQGEVSFQLDRTSTTYATLHIRYQSVVTLRVESASPKRGHYSWTMIKQDNQTKTEHTVVRGGVVNLNCQIQGEPKPLLEWILPDGSKVRAPYSSEDRRIVIYADGKLTLRNADTSDTGMYRCIATNYLDADIMVFRLMVLSPDVEEDEVNGVQLSRPLGGNQVLDCSSSASPKGSVQWILPDHSVLDVSHGTKTLYENGTLEIQGITERDRGFYRCIAANYLGVDLLVSQLTLIEEKTGQDSEGSGVTDVSLIENTIILDETPPTSPYSRSTPGFPPDPPESSHRSQGRGGTGRTWGQGKGPFINRRQWSSRVFNKASRTIEKQKFAEFVKKAQKGSGVKSGTISKSDEDSEAGSAVDLGEDELIIASDSPLGVTVSAKMQQTITTTPEAENKNTQTQAQIHMQPYSRPVKSTYRNLDDSDEMASSQETQIQFTAQPAEPETSTWGAVSITTDPYVIPMSDSGSPRDVVVHTTTDSERQTLLATITTTESQQNEITFHTTQTLKSPHLLAGSTIISKQQIHIIPDKKRSGGHRKIFHSRRRIIKPSRITNVQSLLNQLKQSSNRKSIGTTGAPTIKTTENPVQKTTLSYQSSAITSRSVSKIIRGKIPWSRLFGNKNREKILGRLKKPFISQKLTTTTTAETKTPSIITMPTDVFTTASIPSNSMDEKDILSPLRNTRRKDGSPGDDYEGLSSSDCESTTLRPDISQVITVMPLYQRSFTTPEYPPGLQILPSPPTVKTPSAENEVILSGSGGTPDILPTIRQRPGWNGQKRKIFRGRRPLNRPAAGFHPGKTTNPSATGIKMETTMSQHGTYSRYKPSNKPTNVNLYDKTDWTSSNSTIAYTTTKRPLTASSTLNPTTTLRPTTSWKKADNNKPPTWSEKILIHRPEVNGIKPTVKSSSSQESKERPLTLGPMTVLRLEKKYTSTPTTNNINNAHSSFYDANRIGMTSSSIQVPEVTTNLMMNRPKIIGGNAASYTVLSHSNAYLPCEAVGNPQPTINWRRLSSIAGSTIIIKGKMGKYEVLRNGTLSIHNTNIKDRGQYLCKAENDYGMDKLLVTLSVVAYPSRILEPKIRQKKVLAGSAIEVTCKAEGRPTPLISWILPNQTQVKGLNTEWSRVSVTAEGALVIKDVSMNDRGNYKCIASNQAGGDIAAVQLHVVAAPPGIMEEKRQQVNIRVSQSLLLPCTGHGSPQPTIHWVLHDGSDLHSKKVTDNTRILVHDNGTLHIKDVTQADSGKYECIASSSTGSERRAVTVVVEKAVSAPQIIEISQRKMELFFGDQLRLNCSAIGDPTPKIMWRLPSKAVVDQGHRIGSRVQVMDDGTLIVNSMTDKEAGHYLCVARNKIGDDVKLIRVSVSMKPAKIEPKLYEKKEVTYGNDVKVDCKASGVPKPEISWGLPDGTMVSLALQADVSGGGRARRYTLFDNGTLYLNQVSISEEGDYICYAENHLGKDEMTVHISVMTVTPVIHPPSQTYARVKPGGSIRFDCEAVGEPKPKIFWMLPTNDVIAASNERYLVHVNGSLDIRDIRVSDTGEYVCMARNPAGENRKVYKLDIDGNPPVINGHRQNRTVIKDVAAKFSRKLIDCKAEGNPTPSITWIMPDNIFLTAPYFGSRINVHHNGTLEIRNVRPTDTAEFICLAKNDGGESVMVVQLEVTGVLRRPIFKNPFNERIVSQIGKTIILNCSADGHPSPEIVWTFPNGTRFSNKADHGSHFHIRKDGSLAIRPGKEDAGNYRCGARNYMGYIEKLIILEVGQKPYILTRPRGIIRSVSGEPLFLHCLSEGSPTPKIYWTIPGGHTLSHPQILGRHQLLENGTLLVEDTTLHDRGNYICRARNNAGEAVIIVPVAIIAYPPRITVGPLPNVRAARGAPLQLSCAAIGIPKPEITWELPDRSVLLSTQHGRPIGGEILHPQGTLIIQKPSISDTGRYKCLAKNYLGIDSKVTYVRVL